MSLLSPGVNVYEFDLTTVVPQVSSTNGALAGVFLWGPVGVPYVVDSAITLQNVFFTPSTFNAETWFTAYNFLAYANLLYVVRCANTTTVNTAQSALNAIGNSASIANITQNVVLNKTSFLNQEFTDPNVQFIAKYPGALGNSLRVSYVDSPNAYSSNVALGGSVPSGPNAGNTYTGQITLSTGSNTGVLTFTNTASGTVTAGNTWGTDVAEEFTVGDLLYVGNTGTFGAEYLQISAISNAVTNSSVTTVTLNFTEPYSLSQPFTSNVVQRFWQFATAVQSSPGTSWWANNQGFSSLVDEVNIVVTDQNGQFTGVPGRVLEVWAGLSRANDAVNADGTDNFYRDVINQSSQYIWNISDVPLSNTGSVNSISSSSLTDPVNYQLSMGADGYSESTVPLGVVTAGYDLFRNKENIDISLVMQGKAIGGSGTVNGRTYNNFQLANYIIDNIVTPRQDCIALISPDKATVLNNKGFEATDIMGWQSLTRDTSYGVIDTGYKQQYDQYNNVYRWIPLNGDIAGLCVNTDTTRAPWWSPAGFNRGNIKNVVQLAYNPGQTDRDLLYPQGINPVVTFPNGLGTVLYGDKTMLQNPSAFQHINVRRLFIVLEKAIAKAAQYTLFEFNDVFTQTAFKNLVNPYLRQVEGQRGLYDYLVVCDSTNNTPAIVDANQFVCDIYLKPARSINWIILNFVAVPTGVQFNEVVGTFGGI